jgi:hypothetical protein
MALSFLSFLKDACFFYLDAIFEKFESVAKNVRRFPGKGDIARFSRQQIVPQFVQRFLLGPI